MATEINNTTLAQTNELDKTLPQFKDLTQQMAERFRLLMKLQAAVAVLEKGNKLHYSAGVKVGNQTFFPEGLDISKKEMRSLESLFVKDIKNLPKYFREAKKKKKTTRSGTNNGFSKPMFITEALRNFFGSTKLGPAYTEQTDAEGNVSYVPLGRDLRDCLECFLTKNVTSSSLLTPLFSIYAIQNKMQYADERAFLKATPEMERHFAKIFKALKEDDTRKLAEVQAKIKERVDSGVVLSKEDALEEASELETAQKRMFDSTKFRYSRFPSIVSHCRVNNEELSDEQKAFLADEEIINAVKAEQKIVSETLNYYRALNASQAGDGKAKK